MEAMEFKRVVTLCRDGRLRKYYIINDGNYLVNRNAYSNAVSRIGKIPSDVVDVMIVNYLWLSTFGKLQMLSKCRYFHRVDDSSFYKRTEGESKKRLIDLFNRFEAGQACESDYLDGLKRGNF